MNKSKIMITILLISCILSLRSGTASEPYLGQKPPGMIPEVFAPGLISLPDRFEHNLAISPDGNELIFTVTNAAWDRCDMWYMQCVDDTWTEPTRAYFQGAGPAWDPFFSPDGQELYFVSWITYPGDIRVCKRQGNRWSDSVNMDYPINSGTNEYHPSVTLEGIMYFTSWRGGGPSIYRGKLSQSDTVTVQKLDYPINASQSDAEPFIAPDESYLIFNSNRDTGGGTYGQRGMYISFKNIDESWTTPISLGPYINTPHQEFTPLVSADGKYFFFGRRNGTAGATWSDIYWVDIRAVLPDPNGTIVNLTTGQTFGSIQCAVNYAQSGDTIEIKPGVYQESVTIDKDIIMRSIDPNDPFYVGGTIIQTMVNDSVLTLNGNSPACEIAGLTIRAGSVGIIGTATNTTIRNCRIMDNVTHGIELLDSSSPTLKHCLITSNGQTGITMHPSPGRGMPLCTPIIENCIIVDNGNVAIDGGEPVIIDSIIE